MTDLSPAEKRAADENLPVVMIAPVEALRVAAGHPLITRAVDGGEVLVRLLTVEEAMAAAERGQAWHEERNLPCPPTAPREVFERAVTPVDVEDFARDAGAQLAEVRDQRDEAEGRASRLVRRLDEAYEEIAELTNEVDRYRKMHDTIAEALARVNGTTLRREGGQG